MGRPCPDAAAAALFETIRAAQVLNDYAAFCAVVSERMKAAITPDRFGATAATLGPVLADVERISYMDALKEGEHVVHFWKVDSGAARDILIRMSVQDGAVSGLLFSAPFDTGMGKKG
jgi:hypothetical protein